MSPQLVEDQGARLSMLMKDFIFTGPQRQTLTEAPCCRAKPKGSTFWISEALYDRWCSTPRLSLQRSGFAPSSRLQIYIKLCAACKQTLFTMSRRWLPLRTLNFFYKNLGGRSVFFRFEIIITVLVRSFWFIWIPFIGVYGHCKYFSLLQCGIDFSRQNLTYTDVRLIFM